MRLLPWTVDEMPLNKPTGAKGPASGPPVEMIYLPNALSERVGPPAKAIDTSIASEADAALSKFSERWSEWLREEVAKLDWYRANIQSEGMTEKNALGLYTQAHDLKGLGDAYGYPLVSEIAASLCTLLLPPERRTQAPLPLVDVHIAAIRSAVKNDIRNADDPVSRSLVEELQASVAKARAAA